MKTLTLFLAFLFPLTLLADSFFIGPVSGEIANISNDQGTTSGKEIKSTYRALIKNTLESQGETVTQNKKGADWELSPSILKLGNSFIMSLLKKKNGKVVFAEKLKATTLTDADVVTDRLVLAVVNEEAASKGQTVDKVTQAETRGTSVKTKAQKQFFFGFGPGAQTAIKGAGQGFYYTLGYLWGLDHQVSLRLNLEGVSAKDTEARMFIVGIGTNYYFNRKKHAPYVLGMLTYGSATADIKNDPTCTFWCSNVSESGFGLSAGGGMHFYRTSSVNFAVEASYNQGFYEVASENPGSYGVKIKILW